MPIEKIKSQLKTIPHGAGVYQFFDVKDRVLYVGKAKNLFKRVSSYTKQNQLSARIGRMVFLAQRVEIIRTENEVEALLLEHNLIKKLEPKFNILLRDDKTFPQILITNHQFPQITKYRGDRVDMGSHFGPFASAHDVNKTIDVLRKSFLLRSCADTEFKSRKKPCLEFQIKRCSAPCVGEISYDEYDLSVKNAIGFLSGKSAEVQKNLAQKMQKFSGEHEYEKAATIRDQIKALASIHTKQNINVDELRDFDSIAAIRSSEAVCVYVSFYRGGQNFGARPYFFEIEEEKNLSEFLVEFLGQFYLAQTPPPLILLNLEIAERKLMEEFLGELFNLGKQKALFGFGGGSWSSFSSGSGSPDPDPMFASKGNEASQVEALTQTCGRGQETPSSKIETPSSKIETPSNKIETQSSNIETQSSNIESSSSKVSDRSFGSVGSRIASIIIPKKGWKHSLIKDQEKIAAEVLSQKISQNLNNKELLLEVKRIFDLPKIPGRIEVYDNSHTGGENAVGVLITAGVDGFIKSGYRKFNLLKEKMLTIKKDDTAMLREVLTRRFSKLKKEEYPDFIIIDGGKGQLSAAQEIFNDLKVKIPFICMSKGEDRNAGEEFFHRTGFESFTLPKHHPTMHYLQRLRDEAHRFAIMTHRKKRSKNFIV